MNSALPTMCIAHIHLPLLRNRGSKHKTHARMPKNMTLQREVNTILPGRHNRRCILVVPRLFGHYAELQPSVIIDAEATRRYRLQIQYSESFV